MTLLKDIRVVALTTNVPGPAAAARLRDLGASVAMVEPPSGNLLAHAAPGWYGDLVRGMEVTTLDIKAAADHARFHAMIATADLLITSNRPSALARLGLDWRTLHSEYSRLCQVAIVGYPPPDEDKPGHDMTYLAHLGLLTPPALPRTLLADLAGAERAVSEALALLYARATGGTAGIRYVALSDAAEAFAAPFVHGITRPGNYLGGGLSNYRMYPTKSGYLAVAALEPHFFQRLMRETGAATGSDEELAALFLERSAEEWEAWAAERDLPLAAVK
ncbi:MAG: CoA transferase [Candidatus Hydrogenedentes bacterium]|nr:CoA transferase [Candidatus Hydrogenedentota bacterium]